MEVLNLYEDYTGNLDRLVGLITPYARRLEELRATIRDTERLRRLFDTLFDEEQRRD